MEAIAKRKVGKDGFLKNFQNKNSLEDPEEMKMGSGFANSINKINNIPKLTKQKTTKVEE